MGISRHRCRWAAFGILPQAPPQKWPGWRPCDAHVPPMPHSLQFHSPVDRRRASCAARHAPPHLPRGTGFQPASNEECRMENEEWADPCGNRFCIPHSSFFISEASRGTAILAVDGASRRPMREARPPCDSPRRPRAKPCPASRLPLRPRAKPCAVSGLPIRPQAEPCPAPESGLRPRAKPSLASRPDLRPRAQP
jgi:hypothetical protein